MRRGYQNQQYQRQHQHQPPPYSRGNSSSSNQQHYPHYHQQHYPHHRKQQDYQPHIHPSPAHHEANAARGGMRTVTQAGDRVPPWRGTVFRSEDGYRGEEGYEEVAGSLGMVWRLVARENAGRNNMRQRAACVYHQDVRRMYKFSCGETGLKLLESLVCAKRAALDVNTARIAATAASTTDGGGNTAAKAGEERVRAEGERMYVNKASLEKKGVTWSHQEYSHLGLQAVYLRTKCYQRFTETYNLMDRMRCVMLNIVRDARKNGGTLHVASIGGGPGFELHAVREWVKANAEALGETEADAAERIDLISLDLQADWAPYAEKIGLRFVGDWDLRRGDLIEQCGCDIHIAIISYVLIYTGEESTADMLARMLAPKEQHAAEQQQQQQQQRGGGGDGVKALLISERSHSQPIVSKMERRNVDLVKLMPQHTREGRDDRQLLVLPKGHQRLHEFESPSMTVTFENVPYAKGT